MLPDFRATSRFRVPFGDIDLLKHVNNVAYVRWCETARCNYVEDVLREKIDSARGLILAKQSFDYRAQVGYLHEVVVGARVSRIGTKSFDMDYAVYDVTTDQLALAGSSVIVAYDFVAGGSIAIPPEWRERIRAFEAVAPRE